MQSVEFFFFFFFLVQWIILAKDWTKDENGWTEQEAASWDWAFSLWGLW